MNNLQVNISDAEGFAASGAYKSYENLATEAIAKVNEGTGKGSDFLGWVNLPSEAIADEKELQRIEQVAARLREECEYVVCIGIGGSYLGARAVIEGLSDSFADHRIPAKGSPRILYAGQNVSQDYLSDLKNFVTGHKFGIVVISKSGTTTEPAIAFRIMRELLEKQEGKEGAARLTVAVTDARRGALRTLADTEGYDTFVIPDNVGGRFSVLTPVGLLPIAIAGFDIRKLLAGAAEMQKRTLHASPDNPSQTYACMRNALYASGKKIEIFVDFDPKLHYFAEWWKQLYGESEGKDGKGIFPASVDLTTDLHSMGQWMQQGERTIFETVVEVKETRTSLLVPRDEENPDLDGLGYLAGRPVEDVNAKAAEATRMAHVEGGVPVMRVSIPERDEFAFGELIYFFEKACGISGYLLGVNPFDQPGVEKYKTNMFKLLGKPGY